MPRTDWDLIDQTLTVRRGIIPDCLVATGIDADDIAYRLSGLGCRLVRHNGEDVSGIPDDPYWLQRARNLLGMSRIKLAVE